MPFSEEFLEELSLLELEEIKEELRAFLDSCGISYNLDYRVKDLNKIRQKQELYRSRNEPCEFDDILDVIGFRVSVQTEDEVEIIQALVNSKFKPMKVVDFFNNPKNSGYKAFNCFYDLWGFKTEIQIMTVEMREWTNKTHAEHDKSKYRQKNIMKC